MTPLEQRALAAYFRRKGGTAAVRATVASVTVDALRYIILRDKTRTLAVYRVRIVNGVEVLKGMKRWPSEVEA